MAGLSDIGPGEVDTFWVPKMIFRVSAALWPAAHPATARAAPRRIRQAPRTYQASPVSGDPARHGRGTTSVMTETRVCLPEVPQEDPPSGALEDSILMFAEAASRAR